MVNNSLADLSNRFIEFEITTTNQSETWVYYDLPTGCSADNCFIIGYKIYDGIFQQSWYSSQLSVQLSLKEDKIGMINGGATWGEGTRLKILLYKLI